MAKAKAKRERRMTVLYSVDPVDITNAVWVQAAGVWMFRITVEATIVPPSWPPGCALIGKTAWIKKQSGGSWVDITGEVAMTAVGGNVYEATIAVPEGIVVAGNVVQAWSKATWQTTFSETGNSANLTVPNH